MEKWQGGASGSRGNYQVTYTPGIDLTGPFYQQSHEHPPPQPYPPPPPYPQPYPHPYPHPPPPPYPPTSHSYAHVYDEAPRHISEQAQEEASADQVVVIHDDKEKRKKRDKNYLGVEDETLCSAWLNVSKDPIVGTCQDGKTFWARIRAYFNEHKRTPIERSISSLQHRWGDIKREVAFFTGFYSKVARLNQSGKNEDDKIKDALQLYEGTYEGRQFKFLHCWLVLRHELKWNELVADMSGQNTSESTRKEAPTEAQSSVPETAPGRMERPMGRDRAKKQRSSGGASNSTSCYEMLNKMQLDRVNFEDYMKAINKDECEAISSRSDKKLEIAQKQLELQTRATIVQEKMFDLQQKEREDRIMCMPLDSMEPWAHEYFMNQKKFIAARSSGRTSEQDSDDPQKS